MRTDAFFIAPCLSDSPQALDFIDLKKHFKGAGKGQLSHAINKFIHLNQTSLSFLDVTALSEGFDPFAELQITTGKYIGAIPLRSPMNGKQIGDLLVRPRFSDGKFLFEQLTNILIQLNESIEPEYMDSIPLASGEMVRPPRYYEALKYFAAFETAIKTHWNKFRSVEKTHPYPKASTQWFKYVEHEHDVSKKLIFPSKDNELSPHHLEWQQAKMVFEMARGEILRSATPLTIRLQSRALLQTLSIKIQTIQTSPVRAFNIHSFDPRPIKALKEQGNIFLNAYSKEVCAWRIDVAHLFEKYVQHLIQGVLREMPVRFYKNPRFPSRGFLPSWGLKHLEPDALIEAENMSIAIDAKYKAHYYSRNQISSILKETHRDDLHQILSYCSFSIAKSKAGMLFYPANKFSSQSFYYSNQYNGTRTEIIIVGLPFEAEIKPETSQGMSKLFNKILNPVTA